MVGYLSLVDLEAEAREVARRLGVLPRESTSKATEVTESTESTEAKEAAKAKEDENAA